MKASDERKDCCLQRRISSVKAQSFWRINVKRATGKAKNTEQKKNFVENVVGIKLAYIYKGVAKKFAFPKKETQDFADVR